MKTRIKCNRFDISFIESAFIRSLQVNLSRLIVYAESAEVSLQREVAEKLANEAVKPARQVQIVEYGGLKLLIPLTKSSDSEVQRLAAHALANLSVNGEPLIIFSFNTLTRPLDVADNQKLMARDGAVECLIDLLDNSLELIQRQVCDFPITLFVTLSFTLLSTVS